MAKTTSTTASKEIEQFCLAGLLKFPDFYWETDGIKGLGKEGFTVHEHKIIYDVLTSMIRNREVITSVLVAERLKNLQLNFGSGFSAYEFMESLELRSPNEEGLGAYFKELGKLCMCRDIINIGKNIQTLAEKHENASIQDVIASVDKEYGKLNDFTTNEKKPQKVLGKMEEFIEIQGNKTDNSIGIDFPYAQLTDAYGGLRKGLFIFAARPKTGKSAFSLYTTLAASTGLHGKDSVFRAHYSLDSKGEDEWHAKVDHMFNNYDLDRIAPILYLDTEMEEDEVLPRLTSIFTNIKPAYFESGEWRNHDLYVKRVRHIWPLVKKIDDALHYQNVISTPIEQIIPLAKRWKLKDVGRDRKAIFVYDYLKITGESTSSHNQEYMIIGEKATKLKDLSSELGIPIIVPIQNNRMGESRSKKTYTSGDDSTVVAMSDRVGWFCTFLGILRFKSHDEFALHGKEWGQYCFVPHLARFQGLNKNGFEERIQLPDGSWAQNFFSMEMNNGVFLEKGSVKDMVAAGKFRIDEVEEEEDESMP